MVETTATVRIFFTGRSLKSREWAGRKMVLLIQITERGSFASMVKKFMA